MHPTKKAQIARKYGPLVAEHIDRAMQAKAEGNILKESIHTNLAYKLHAKQLNEKREPQDFGVTNNPATNGNLLKQAIKAALTAAGWPFHFVVGIRDVVHKLWNGGQAENIRGWAEQLDPPIRSENDLVQWFANLTKK